MSSMNLENSSIKGAIALFKQEYENPIGIKHKFGDMYIQIDGQNALNVTHRANQSAEYIFAELEKHVNKCPNYRS